MTHGEKSKIIMRLITRSDWACAIHCNPIELCRLLADHVYVSSVFACVVGSWLLAAGCWRPWFSWAPIASRNRPVVVVVGGGGGVVAQVSRKRLLGSVAVRLIMPLASLLEARMNEHALRNINRLQLPPSASAAPVSQVLAPAAHCQQFNSSAAACWWCIAGPEVAPQ